MSNLFIYFLCSLINGHIFLYIVNLAILQFKIPEDYLSRLLGEDNNTDMGIIGDPSNQYERLGIDSYDSATTPRTNRNASSSKDPKDINIRITPFGQRINKFTSQFLFNYQNTDNSLTSQELENLEDDVIRRVQPAERCNLQVHHLQPESGCRFMYDRTEDQVIIIISMKFHVSLISIA